MRAGASGVCSYHLEEPDLSIWPLTFLQVYQTADTVMCALLEKDASFRRLFVSSEGLRQVGRYLIVPFYYHLLTSGYGAMVGNQQVGWLYLRGWHQVLYVETLTIHPDWRRKGVGTSLLQFAEEQARVLGREWMALTGTLANEPAIALYEKAGYRRGHWRVMRHTGELRLDGQAPANVTLHPVLGPAAEIAYRTYSEQDQRAGDGWAAEAIVRLSNYDPYRGLGGEWVIEVDGKTAGYLNIHLDDGTAVVYFSTGPEWWGRADILKAAFHCMQPAERQLPILFRAASSDHHDAARPALTEMGFVEEPADTARFYKHLPAQQ
jgi:GNAT superfamily N-acetyltransferase